MAEGESMGNSSDEPKELVHKTKIIHFLGRQTPIILQNDNGPCPLLAICNVLLLKNNLNLSPDIAEVSQEKLLSLVAERLIDSNSNVNDKDAEYIENQQQNIADAIDLLPRLTTGIDVNIKFRRISDFEFTRECAIFDLLDIPLYHGWIVDPQDDDTVDAIGSKSYNGLTGELVALETRYMGSDCQKNSGEDCIDFAAATTATLGVPSPCLSRGRSFDDSPRSIPDDQNGGKGDIEEEAELLRALKLSEGETPTSAYDVLGFNINGESLPVDSNESEHAKQSELVLIQTLGGNIGGESEKYIWQEPSIFADLITFETVPEDVACSSSKNDQEQLNVRPIPEEIRELDVQPIPEEIRELDVQPIPEEIRELDVQPIPEKSGEHVLCKDDGRTSVDFLVESGNTLIDSCEQYPSFARENCMHDCGGDEKVSEPTVTTADIHETENKPRTVEASNFSLSSTPNVELDSSNSRGENIDVHEAFISSADGSEPIYEGEECMLDSVTKVYQDREPMYEGEVVLAEQVDKDSRISHDTSSKDEITPEQGELIRNFLKNSASQLTIYGLFCLQEDLKEREICVFFRNNHFNTMFKFDGQLYLLATDQGYINQPDLVWEKLNEVNGNTLFMTGNFKEFKVEENHANNSWNQHNALANTADYLASMDNSAQPDSGFNSDLQLAIALQQQEFEQQPPQRNSQSVSSGSRMVTGPNIPRSKGKYTSSSNQDTKASKESKDKCVVM